MCASPSSRVTPVDAVKRSVAVRYRGGGEEAKQKTMTAAQNIANIVLSSSSAGTRRCAVIITTSSERVCSTNYNRCGLIVVVVVVLFRHTASRITPTVRNGRSETRRTPNKRRSDIPATACRTFCGPAASCGRYV